ncbi:MAG: serine/threonine protein kinase, partial [Polyangiales bacterium]
TPAYMSPEQLLAQPVDARSDLWSVAALVYRIVTGDLPFGSGTLAEMGIRIVTLDPKPPSSLVPGLPPAFDAWMAKGLAKGAADRFQTAQELADALLEVAGAQGLPFGIHPTPLPESGPRLAELVVEPEPITRREGKPALERSQSGVRRVRRPWRALLAVTFVLACALAASRLVPSAPSANVLSASLSAPLPTQPEPAASIVAPPPQVSVSASSAAEPPPKKLKSKYKLAK